MLRQCTRQCLSETFLVHSLHISPCMCRCTGNVTTSLACSGTWRAEESNPRSPPPRPTSRRVGVWGLKALAQRSGAARHYLSSAKSDDGALLTLCAFIPVPQMHDLTCKLEASLERECHLGCLGSRALFSERLSLAQVCSGHEPIDPGDNASARTCSATRSISSFLRLSDLHRDQDSCVTRVPGYPTF